MTGSQIFNLIGGGSGVILIILAVIKLLENRSSLKASKPKNDADTESVNLQNQRGVIDTLKGENSRLTERVTKAETSASEAKSRADELETRLLALERSFNGFKDRVEDLLTDNKIQIPDWWHQPNT